MKVSYPLFWGSYEEICTEDFEKRQLYAIVKESFDCINEDLELDEIEFLTQYALNDFKHYLLQKFGFYDKFNFDSKRVRKFLCKLLIERSYKLRNLACEWIKLWFLKWRQRVKIVFSSETKSQNVKEFQLVDNILKSIPKKIVDYYKRLIVSLLIQHLEICTLDIVSENILKVVVLNLMGRYGREKIKSILLFRPDLVRQEILKTTLELIKSKQPFVILFIKIRSPEK